MEYYYVILLQTTMMTSPLNSVLEMSRRISCAHMTNINSWSRVDNKYLKNS